MYSRATQMETGQCEAREGQCVLVNRCNAGWGLQTGRVPRRAGVMCSALLRSTDRGAVRGGAPRLCRASGANSYKH